MTEAALQHARLRERVAAFADGELPLDEARSVREHLRTCTGCQRELALQQDLSRALGQEPIPEASPDLRRRIGLVGASAARRRPLLWNRRWAAPAAAALVLIAAGGAALLRGHLPFAARPAAEIPVLRDALADCRRVMGRNFPKKADVEAVRQGLPFSLRTLDKPDAELFSTWKTTLAGAPAVGLAYRWRGMVVVQYAVPTELIREQREIGAALREGGFYAASEQGQGIVAFLAGDSGTLLVSDAPPQELRQLIL